MRSGSIRFFSRDDGSDCERADARAVRNRRAHRQEHNAFVLIEGESGAGKERVARAPHHFSMRCAKPWVDVICAALPASVSKMRRIAPRQSFRTVSTTGISGTFAPCHVDRINDPRYTPGASLEGSTRMVTTSADSADSVSGVAPCACHATSQPAPSVRTE